MKKELVSAGLPPLQERDLVIEVDTAPEPEKRVLHKPNEAVAMRPTSGKLTLLSRRIWNTMLSVAHTQHLEGRSQFVMSLGQLIKDSGFNSNNTAVLKDVLADLQVALVEWNTEAVGEKRWARAQLLGGVEIVERGPGYETVLRWDYPSQVREQLLVPQRYTRMMLMVANTFRTFAGATLYEIGCQYLTNPSGRTMKQSVTWWAEVLRGKVQKTPIVYGVFKRDTLLPALKEITERQDQFVMQVLEYRSGSDKRRVTELQFVVKRRAPDAEEDLVAPDQPLDLELYQSLEAMGISQIEAAGLIDQYKAEVVAKAVDVIRDRSSRSDLAPIENQRAFLLAILERGFDGAFHGAAKKMKAAKAKAEPKKTAEPAVVKVVEPEDEIIRAARKAETAWSRYDALADAEKEFFLAEFLSSSAMQVAVFKKRFTEGGLASPLIRSLFGKWLSERWSLSETGA